MFFKKNKKITLLILAILIVSSLFFTIPKKASAVWGVGDTVIEVGTNLFTNLKNTISTIAMELKEFVLDELAWTTANILIEEMADSTVDWINSGFEDGGPGFITDFTGTLEETANQALGEFIEGSSLAFLCSPFSLPIKIALSLQFGGKREAHCTLSSAFANIDNAINDLGNNWSWDKFNVISQPQNNTYGAYLDAYTELSLKTKEEKDKTIIKSKWGGGFLEFDHCTPGETKEECRDVEDTNGSITQVCENVTGPEKCETQTPGKLIGDSLNDTLGLGGERLTIADEIDEVAGALLIQLIKSVFSSEGLLRSNPGGNNNENFTKIPAKIIEDIKDEMITPALETEEDYIEAKQTSLDHVNLAEAYIDALIACWNSYTFTGDNPLSETEITTKINTLETMKIQQTDPLQISFQTEIDIAITSIGLLEGLLEDLIDATDPTTGEGNPEKIQAIINAFKALELHDEIDIAETEVYYIQTIKPAMDAIISYVLSEKNICEAGNGSFVNPNPNYIPEEPEE